MNDNTLIRVKDLSKKYFLQDNTKLKEVEVLNNIIFELKRKQIIGIVGENGAGKSTLLKILAGYIKPTNGEVEIFGKVNSLIEIGGNFIPELTGKENVKQFLKLNSKEDNSLINKIKDFSELGDYFEQPIKYYSSGMFVRLAVSAGFYIDADIFLIDEILMAGDAAFKSKVSSYFKKLAENEVGIIMASHNPQEILDNCNLVLWLNEGVLMEMGDPETVLENYYDFLNKKNLKNKSYEAVTMNSLEKYCKDISELDKKYLENKNIKIESFEISSNKKIYAEEGFLMKLEYFKKNDGLTYYPIYRLYDSKMNFIGVLPSIDDSNLKKKNELLKEYKGSISFDCRFPKNILNAGVYYLELAVGSEPDEETGYSKELYKLKVKIKFEVFFKSENLTISHYDTAIRPECSWELKCN